VGEYEILEHTADVGLRIEGANLEEVFGLAAMGLLDITGTTIDGNGEPIEVEVQADDIDGLLVAWLSELLYLLETRDVLVTGVGVDSVRNGEARGTLEVVPREGREVEGTDVKAITYHQLEIRQVDGSWRAKVFLDI
jgi:SHS2 domain-containing protein